MVLREINIRDCFRPDSMDNVFLSADFNQMEMRIMAHMSNDSQLVRFFNTTRGGDIYVFMASMCFDCDEATVTKEQRTCAKQLSLAVVYGMGADLMAKKLTRFTGRTYSDTEAVRLIAKWKEKVSIHSDIVPLVWLAPRSLPLASALFDAQFSGVARFMLKAKQDALANVSRSCITASIHVRCLLVVS